jgi:hypothetical protein
VAVGVVEGFAVQAAIDPRNFDVDEYLDAAKDLLERPGKSARSTGSGPTKPAR